MRDYFKNITKYYKPAEPINQPDLFVGREAEKTLLYKSLLSGGKTPVIYGARGVGKTSLINITCKYFCDKNNYVLHKHICSSQDDFQSVFNTFLRNSETNIKIGRVINKNTDDTTGGINLSVFKLESTGSNSNETEYDNLTNTILTPSIISELFKDKSLLLIIDEFDQIQSSKDKILVAETIKALSDNNSKSKIIISGVGNSLIELVYNHQSTLRNLLSIQVPRMTDSEILNIVANGSSKLKINFDEQTLNSIVWLSDGLPYFTHLICECLADYAFYSNKYRLDTNDLQNVLSTVLENMSLMQIVEQNYHNAYLGPSRKLLQTFDAIFGQPIDTYCKLPHFSGHSKLEFSNLMFSDWTALSTTGCASIFE